MMSADQSLVTLVRIGKLKISDMKLIKIHGLQRTATNYVQMMLDKNFQDVLVGSNACGSKHGQVFLANPNMNEEELFAKDHIPNRANKFIAARKEGNLYFAITMKHPYSWVVSFAKYRSKPINKRNVTFWINKKYNHLNSHFVDVLEKNPLNTVMLRYEDIVRDYRGMLKKIQKKFEFTPRGKFTDIVNEIRPKRNLSGKKFDKDFYKQHHYMKKLNPNILKLIRKDVSKRVIEFCGYQL